MCSYPAALWVAAHHAARCAGQHGAARAAAAEAAARRASKCPALHSGGRKGQVGSRQMSQQAEGCGLSWRLNSYGLVGDDKKQGADVNC